MTGITSTEEVQWVVQLVWQEQYHRAAIDNKKFKSLYIWTQAS